uniref:Uncharacterized protein n=1 Tax=Tetranychus urticae TaxID=32264 RepID=T1L254_TETUR
MVVFFATAVDADVWINTEQIINDRCSNQVSLIELT